MTTRFHSQPLITPEAASTARLLRKAIWKEGFITGHPVDQIRAIAHALLHPKVKAAIEAMYRQRKNTEDAAPITRKEAEHILRACEAYRKLNPTRRPGQTEKLCKALLDAWDKINGPEVCFLLTDQFCQHPDGRPIVCHGQPCQYAALPNGSTKNKVTP